MQQAVPGGYLDAWTAASAKYQAIDRKAIKAIVAIAPWGEQPPYSAWDAEGLAGIRIPSLFISGDQDDVADYAKGIRPAFEQAVHSDRYLLVYENARHNTGGNPPPVGVPIDYAMRQSYDEPVWRKDRMAGINQHFITAFLDMHLKGDATRREYLDVAPEQSSKGVWKATPGAAPTAFSNGRDADGNTFWKGFQRRSALGMQMLHRNAASQ